MTEREQPQEQPDYWNVDQAIGEVTLWRDQHYTLRLKAHIADELYRQPARDEIIPLKHRQGVRTYVHAKPYVLVPDITLGIQLFPTPDPTGAVGEVASSTWEGMRHEELGNCQGWFYLEDRSIVLWEALLLERYRMPDLAQDSNTTALWEGFEQFLTERFPSARLIATTYDDPEYETQQYQEFLQRLGYSRLNPQAFGKTLSSTV